VHRVAVVILNYRTPDMTLDCAASVAPELGPDDALIIVDNQSGDDSVPRIEAGLRARGLDRARLIASPVNGGFAAGNNLGIRAASAEAYFLLNSDTLLRPGAIERLWSALAEDARVGLVSPRLVGGDGAPQVNCFRRHTPVSELLAAARTGPIDKLLERWLVPIEETPAGYEPEWTSFAAVLIRKQVLEQVGLLDEGFFMYFEDVEYCLRARARGWTIRNVPEAEVVHFHGVSSKVEALTAARRRRPAYYYAARRRYFTKTFGAAGLLLANALWTLGRGIAWAREVTGTKRPHAVEGELVDTWLG
jgi:N-acetylglucosaminyl-diphospho-decaprenol L-rhamnosyltransferase